MKLCRHVVKYDAGLAPNPFHGYCTSALCTPSHSNLKQLGRGDWLIGHSSKNDGNRLVYAMRISEVMRLNQYFDNQRFQLKKPKPNGKPFEQCGDNIYYRRGLDWRRLPSRFHNNREACIQDVGTRHSDGNRVYISECFYYFGAQRIMLPDDLKGIIVGGQGCRYTTGQLAEEFVTWLEANHERGIQGMPRDMADLSGESDPMLTDWDTKSPQVGGEPAPKVANVGRCG